MDKATLRDGRLYGPIKAEDVPKVIEALRAARRVLKAPLNTYDRTLALGDMDIQMLRLPPYIKEMVDG